jgi:hypothetical protein
MLRNWSALPGSVSVERTPKVGARRVTVLTQLVWTALQIEQ